MPETAAAGCLARYRHFPGPEIDDSQPCRFLPGAGWAPGRFLSRVGAVDRSPCLRPTARARDLAMTHDRHGHFIAGDHRLMRYPFIRSLGIERTQTTAI